MKPFFVYLLRCRNGSYYVGNTDDLETRVAQHQHGTYDGHTCRLRPVTLVWSMEVETRDAALALEFRVKRWSRAKKAALVASDWESLKRAARGPDKARPSTPADSRTPARPSTPAASSAAYARGDRIPPPVVPSVGPKGRSRGAAQDLAHGDAQDLAHGDAQDLAHGDAQDLAHGNAQDLAPRSERDA